ncbi:MAG: hypothetical protein NTV70_14495 [Acidobacteria bacterium]|nr:hypothetical protein [Acidobacteriota bacterium]
MRIWAASCLAWTALSAAGLPEIAATAPAGAAKLMRPGTRGTRVANAGASRIPWVDANGWRLRRETGKMLVYENVPDQWIPLAVAESYVYAGQTTLVTTKPELAQPMMDFVKSIDQPSLPPVADIGLVDDGTPQTGEAMNLMARRNLLFQPIKQASGPYKLIVQIGSEQFPKSATNNPSEFANLVRQGLTDPKRSLRIYGSETIIGYLTAEGNRARLHLLNYSSEPIEGIRIRVAGAWKVASLRSFNDANAKPEEEELADGGLEFGLERLSRYAVVDLTKR